jgi:hypothetical protein
VKWRLFLKIFSIPVLFFTSLILLCIYFAWSEFKIKNDLVDQSLKGNPVAIEILIKYEKPWKLDTRLIYEAMNGNEHAIKVLGVNPSKGKDSAA